MTRSPVTSFLILSMIAGASTVASAQQAKPTVAASAPAAPAVAAPPAVKAAAPAPAPAVKAAVPAAAPAPAPTAKTTASAPAAHPAAPAPVAAVAAKPATPAPVMAQATAPVPKPAPELDQMKALEGSWRCDGRAPAGPGGPEHAYKSTWKFKRDLDNFWWAADYQQAKAKTNPAPMKARGYLTFDPSTKGFVMWGVDNMGGTTSESTSGWAGDTVTLAGDASMAGKKVPFREVITKKGEREFTWRGEMKMGADWVTLGEDRCKK